MKETMAIFNSRDFRLTQRLGLTPRLGARWGSRSLKK